MTGPDVAAELARTKPSVLSIDGHKLDPFYAHRPIQRRPAVLSQEAAQQYNSINNEELTEMLFSRKSISERLQSLQERVQRLLDQR